MAEDDSVFGRVGFIAQVVDQYFDVLSERSAGRQAQA
jgi:hypothetical protein